MYISITLQAVALGGLYTAGSFLYNRHDRTGEYLVSTASTAPLTQPFSSSVGKETFTCKFQNYVDDGCEIFVIEKSSNKGFGSQDFKLANKNAFSKDFYTKPFFKLRLNTSKLPRVDLSKKNLIIALKNISTNLETYFRFHALFVENRFEAYVNYFLTKGYAGEVLQQDFGSNSGKNKFQCTVAGIPEIEITEAKTCIVNVIDNVKSARTDNIFEKTELIEKAMKGSTTRPLPSINKVNKYVFEAQQLFILKISNKFWKNIIDTSNSQLNFSATIFHNTTDTNNSATQTTFSMSNIRSIAVIEKSDAEVANVRITDPEQTHIKEIF